MPEPETTSSNRLLIDCSTTACEPGATVEGTVFWDLAAAPGIVYARTVWWTEGRGDRDETTIDQHEWTTTATVGKEVFRFHLPDLPCSFSGKLISLCWGIVLETRDGEVDPAVHRLVMAPGGREIRLHPEP